MTAGCVQFPSELSAPCYPLPNSDSEAVSAYALVLTCSIITVPTPEAGQRLPMDKNSSLQPLETSRKLCVFLGLSNTSA